MFIRYWPCEHIVGLLLELLWLLDDDNKEVKVRTELNQGETEEE